MRRSIAVRATWAGVCVVLAGAVGASAAAGAAAGKAKADPNVPAGYRLLYSQAFDQAEAMGDFEFTDADKWKWASAPRDDKAGAKVDNGCLESTGPGKYRPAVRSPLVIALLSGRVFEDFILEADLLQTGKEYGHRDLCLFFGLAEPGKYYYVHLATKADQNAHNIFLVNDKPRRNIATKTTKGIDWGKDVWHHVRLERKGSDGTIRVFFDDMTRPIMLGKDTTHRAGRIGLGSFDDVGRFDNLRIWGPRMERKEKVFFQVKGKAAAGGGAK